MRSLLVGLLAVVATAACDESFSPIQPSDLRLSVFGYLDASADTQWIRVMPIRSLVVTSPGPLAARVTLRHLGTGRVIELRDSLLRFDNNPEIGSDGSYLHSFWTTEKIEAGAAYRFSAALPEGDPSEAMVEIPSEYEVEVWIDQLVSRENLLRVAGVEHVAFAIVTIHAYDQCGSAVERTFLETDSSATAVHMIPIVAQFLPRRECGTPQIEKEEILIVGSKGAWPSAGEQATARLGLLDFPSNISGSVGFLGGVLTKVVPYETCLIESALSSPDPCRLRYDDAAATLRGRVVDALCGGGATAGAIAGATVELREIDPNPAARRRVRTANSARLGEFQIGALEGGKRYALRAFRVTTSPLPEYEEHTDTLELAVGEQATYEVGLRRSQCAR